MKTIKSIYVRIVTNQAVMRVVHTFWQTFMAVFVVGVLPIFNSVVAGHYSDAKVATVALVTAAVSAGLAAVKGIYVSKKS